MPLREARREDIRRIVEMLADDEVARGREDFSGDMAAYEVAFDAIAGDPNNTLYVWDHEGAAMGCLQLTFIPGMSYHGSWIAKVEGVRVDRSLRGLGNHRIHHLLADAKTTQRAVDPHALDEEGWRSLIKRRYERLLLEIFE